MRGFRGLSLIWHLLTGARTVRFREPVSRNSPTSYNLLRVRSGLVSSVLFQCRRRCSETGSTRSLRVVLAPTLPDNGLRLQAMTETTSQLKLRSCELDLFRINAREAFVA